MKHNFFHKAITEAYAGLISGDMIPSYFLYFTVDPSIIDVNIHPTKTENFSIPLVARYRLRSL